MKYVSVLVGLAFTVVVGDMIAPGLSVLGFFGAAPCLWLLHMLPLTGGVVAVCVLFPWDRESSWRGVRVFSSIPMVVRVLGVFFLGCVIVGCVEYLMHSRLEYFDLAEMLSGSQRGEEICSRLQDEVEGEGMAIMIQRRGRSTRIYFPKGSMDKESLIRRIQCLCRENDPGKRR